MRISEIAPIKPKTPQQQRLDALRRQKAALQKRIDTERGLNLLAKRQRPA
jgi:hypothetical protein